MTDTQLAQMALSAIVRSGENVDIITLSEVLRGHNTRAVKALGLSQIRTFGVGRAWSKEAWFYMLIQMLQQALFLIDYKGNYSLKVTEEGRKVLKGEREIVFEDDNHDKTTKIPREYLTKGCLSEVDQQTQSLSCPSDPLQLQPLDDVQNPKALSCLKFKRNGVQIIIEPEMSEAIDWKTITQSIHSKIYWNYQGDMWININQYVPVGIENREEVKARLLEVVSQVENIQISGESLHIPKKEDYDIHGNIVQPLNLPFDDCLCMLRAFIEKNGRYPSMKAEAGEVVLRKWFREAWHRIIPISDAQRDQLAKLTEEHPLYLEKK